ncbi:hypothetical protein FRC09_013987 [Ceratobasidium sp. 395]|nr:hypothetical protein FRC09_013987 [Ceratobasidium sp. 395]
MSTRKPVESDPDWALTANRSRRSNAGVPRLAFDAVNERLEMRTRKSNKDAKASAAAAIEADPLTGDDAPERNSIGEFVPPARIGDNEIDQSNYDKARTDYLINFIAQRDALDVRPDLASGRLDLADLEEIFADPDAAAEEPADDIDMPTQLAKGKSKAVAKSNAQDEGDDDGLLAETGYTGITMDPEDYVIKAKHAPKNATSTQAPAPNNKKRIADQDEGNSRKSRRGAPGASQAKSGLQIASTSKSSVPLSRTDSTTLVEGRPLVHPNFSREAANPLSATAGSSSNASLSKSRNTKALSTPTQHISAPKQQPSGTQLPAAPKNQPTQPIASAPTQSATNKRTTGHAASSRGVTQAKLAPAALARPSAAHGPSRPPVPAEPCQPVEQIQRENENDPEDFDDDLDLEEHQGEEPGSPGSTKKRGAGKAYIISFPEHEQPTITTMAKIARARIIANGTYDDSDHLIHTKYPEWPEEWEPRKSRHTIVAESLQEANNQHGTNIPFSVRHVQCVNILITTHRTIDSKSVKALVDQFFKFTVGESQRNKEMSKKLVPQNFVYKDIPNKRGPFENVLLKYTCQVVAFDGNKSIGAKYPEYFDGLPPGFLAYVSSLIHFVVWCYQTGKFKRDDLNVGVQTSSFRRALRFAITTHQNKPTIMFSQRNIIYDYCMDALEPQDKVRDPSPEPEREWTPDAAEPYISRYAGQQVRTRVQANNEDVDMDDREVDEIEED